MWWPICEIGIFRGYIRRDISVFHVIKDNLGAFNVPSTSAIEPSIFAERDHAPVSAIRLERENCR